MSIQLLLQESFGWRAEMHPEPPATVPNTSSVATEASPPTHPIERHRPGRVAYTNPHLIARLRHHVPAARGIGVGVLIGASLWAGIIALGWWLIVG